MRPAREEVRRDVLVVAAAAAVLFLPALGARDLWNPNEPVYGRAVVEMAERGDWLVPTVHGRAFGEKPVLYFWLARAASAAAGGVSELSLRLPSAAAAGAGAVLLYLLVAPYAGRGRARLAALLYATTFAVFWGARTVQMDILVTASTLAVILAVSRVLDHGLSPRVGAVLAGVAAGCGLLAKGPVAVLLPGLPLIVWVVLTGRSRSLASPAILLSALVAAAVAAPWFVALAARGESGMLAEFFVRQHVERVLDPWDHQRPPWYYLRYFWIDMAPWAAFVPLAAFLPARDRDARRLDVLAWLWIVLPVALFSLSPSKRSAYILPVAPAVAVLVAGVVERWLERSLDRMRARLALGLVGLGGVVALAAALALAPYARRFPDLAAQAGSLEVLLGAGGAAILVALALPRRRLAAPTALFSLVVVVYLWSAVVVLPAVDAYKSARPFCRRVDAVLAPEDDLVSFGQWEWRANYAFYLGRSIPNLETVDDLRRRWLGDARVCVIVQSTELPAAAEVLGDRRPWVEAPIGSRTAFLFCNR